MFNGFTYDALEKELIKRGSSFVYGEPIKSHTAKKIELVSKYVDNWLYVVSNSPKIKDIYFIDVMSNAGLYESKQLATYVEVLNLFVRHAKEHRDKCFHLISNDYDSEKYKTMKAIRSLYLSNAHYNGIRNIDIDCHNEDANNLLWKLTKSFQFDKQRVILLYVDPYCFLGRELAVSTILFCKRVYCELIVNYYYNDYIRNYKNRKAPNKIQDINEFATLCGADSSKDTPDQVMGSFINKMISSTHFKYRYLFRMRNACNGILYYLIYFTPKFEGLEKIKDATYKSFQCNDEYSPSYKPIDGINIFGRSENEDNEYYILEETKNTFAKHKGKTLKYREIAEYLLQYTPIPAGRIIEAILKPLIRENILKKMNLNGPRNYKDDSYFVN